MEKVQYFVKLGRIFLLIYLILIKIVNKVKSNYQNRNFDLITLRHVLEHVSYQKKYF